ncbi:MULTISPECIES: hypothetical protein [unclassified Arcicella]|uniref:hypothetical protein n=1 Tax=unclassified Arcicella TaxID=2644986 RepID=UPI002865C403|nr:MULTISPECIES: hypothetical protein [unclassified Arcicella]MDR6564943.1 hypothetical protein [Arcicella sp. BE51]MDR6814733.1 hypothetical protein [Arcicella sp. BE140]MDR6826179.1 hypothetical protein [Arcicella sp. BE139]
MANIKHKKGINTIKHFKVSDELFQKFNEKSKEFESGEDLLREAITEYLFPEKTELIPPIDLEERTHTISAKVSVDTAHFFNVLANSQDCSIETILGELATRFSMNTVNFGISTKRDFLTMPILESDLAEIDKQFAKTESMAYEDFLLDTFRAGLLARNAEKRETAAATQIGNIHEKSGIIEIDLNEIDSKKVIESLELFGFDESRYLTTEKESELRESFKNSISNVEGIGFVNTEEIKEAHRKEIESLIEKYEAEIVRLKAENPERTALIKQFQDYINSTKEVVKRLENAHSLKCVFFKVSRAEIAELYPEHLRHLI